MGDGQRDQMMEQMSALTLLRRKIGRDLEPASMHAARKDGGMLIYFSCPSKPIQVDENQLILETRMGPLETKAKFKLKDMVWKGQLSL